MSSFYSSEKLYNRVTRLSGYSFFSTKNHVSLVLRNHPIHHNVISIELHLTSVYISIVNFRTF